MAVGKIGEYGVGRDTWSLYSDRLQQYFVVNKIEEPMHVPTLITVMGGEAYELLVNLCTPASPATKTFKEIDEIMKTHLQPQPSQLAERFKFRQRTQQPGESVAQYVAELKKLSRYCTFGEWLQESLRDQLACGLRSEEVRQRLFAEEKVTFVRAYQLALSMEAAEKDAASVAGSSTKNSAEVEKMSCHAVKTGLTGRSGYKYHTHKSTGAPPAANSAGSCSVCGNGAHTRDDCRYRRYTCKVCNQEGHLKKMCPRLRGESSGTDKQVRKARNNFVQQAEDSSDDEVRTVEIFNIDFENCDPIMKDIIINGKVFSFEIDTGSAISIISRKCYNKFLSHIELKPSKLRLKYYSGESVKVDGKLTVSVQHKNVNKLLELYVVECGKVSLLGRQWLAELGIELPTLTYHNEVKETRNVNIDMLSSRYCKVFQDGLGRYTAGTVGLHIREGSAPVYMRARPLPYALRAKVEAQLSKLVSDGVLTPVDTSDWATPIVPVLKKDGSLRICADYKVTLNRILEVDRYPVPRVEDVLSKIQGEKKFSKLDLSQAYAQFELDDASKPYTTINTHKGLFQYNRLIYGLASSPGIFQRKLEQMFCDLGNVGVFLDDIIVTGKNDEEHFSTLHEVCQRLQRYGLRVRKDKCVFFKDSVTYLGYVVSREGIHTCSDKIEAINKTPVPQNVSELRAFLGLVMYYAKFVKGVSTILAPLYELLKKGRQYIWSKQCGDAFEKIKKMLTSSAVLTHYSQEQELILTCDASAVGVGAVISHITPQGERPVAYASRSLNSAERSYSQIDKEALAIVFGVRKFNQYLYGRKFTLRTDHKPLVSILGPKCGIPIMAASRLQRWAVLLSGYNYDVEYVPTKSNCADGLSRLPAAGTVREGKSDTEATYVKFVEEAIPLVQAEIRKATESDRQLCKVAGYVRSGCWPARAEDELRAFYCRRSELYLEGDCLMWGYRMVIPEIYRSRILRELHGAHLGIVKTKGIARSYVWWPGVDADVERTCRECAVCSAEADAPARSAPQPWHYPPEPWTRLHVDFVGPYKHLSFLVLIDATTKWIEIFKMKQKNASSVINKLRETFARFGLCTEIVSDNGPPFDSIEFKRFLDNNGIKQTLVAPYHQSSNGAAEGAVKLCKKAIKKAHREGVDVDVALQSYLLAYRNCTHSTTGASPAALLQRRTLRCRLDLLRREGGARVRDVQAAQVAAAAGAQRELGAGERVWTRQYRKSDKWTPGQIAEQLGSRDYTVSQENGPTLHRHIDQLRRRRSGLRDAALPPPPPAGQPAAEAARASYPVSTPSDARICTETDALPEADCGRQSEAAAPAAHEVAEVTVPPLLRPQRVTRKPNRYGYDY